MLSNKAETEPVTPSVEETRKALIALAIDSWRFARLFGRVLTKLDAVEATRFSNQLRYFSKNLEEHLEAANLKIVTLEGQLYDPGVAASPLNIGDFGANDVLIVGQMVEPIIMGHDGVVRPGIVMLQKVVT
jgi:hypothetical protein